MSGIFTLILIINVNNSRILLDTSVDYIYPVSLHRYFTSLLVADAAVDGEAMRPRGS